jgi:hypothetical protein
MKKLLLLFVFLTALSSVKGFAQSADTMYSVKLEEVNITDKRKWANDTAWYRYNQMRYYVTTILPYLNAATKIFSEIDYKLNDNSISKRDKKDFINAKETAMREQFENKIKTMNTTQGVLLMKLIARQTGVNIYHILDEFKSPFTAIKWQTWARLNGMNINQHYKPENEKDLEDIMEDLGYPLPPFYKQGSETALQNY